MGNRVAGALQGKYAYALADKILTAEIQGPR